MKKTTSCPEAAELGLFAAGRFTDDDMARVAAHLDTCASCWRLVESRPPDEAFCDDVRWAARLEAETSIEVNVSLERLNALLLDYEVLEEIGRGGMGIVFKARHLRLNRIVALKILPALFAIVRSDAVARFRREAALAARLEHTNIIVIYDSGEVDGTLYYAMQFIPGPTLRDVLEELRETNALEPALRSARANAAMPSAPTSAERSNKKSKTEIGASARLDKLYFQQVASWMAEVCEALHYAHFCGIIHRDIKPSNLIISPNGRLMITDFGLARSNGVATVTASKSILGTARYMSPEQVEPSAAPLDVRSDVYSLGATLYELLTLQPMFAGQDDRSVMNCVMFDEPVRPSRHVPSVPWELETICLKATEKQRGMRYETAQAMADDLRRWLLDLPILARRPKATVRIGKWIRRRKAAATLGTICAVLVCGLAIALSAYRERHRDADALRAEAINQRIELIAFDASRAHDRADYKAALATIEEGLSLDPKSRVLLNLKAMALTASGRSDEALAAIDQVLAIASNDWRAHYTAASILANWSVMTGIPVYEGQANLPTMAPAARLQRFHRHRDALASILPDSPELNCLLASETSDPRKARELIDRALARRPSMMEALRARVACSARLKEYDEMLLDAERLLAIMPTWSGAHSFRAEALAQCNRLEEADEAYGKAIAIQPAALPTWQARSLIRTRRGEYAGALADANRVIAGDPQYAMGFFARARAYIGLGQPINAQADLDEAIRLSPNETGSLVNRAGLYYDTGRYEDAIRDLTRVIQLNPESSEGYRNRGIALLRLRLPDRAIADLQSCLRLNPNDPSAHRTLGRVQAELGIDKDAVSSFSRAIELDSTCADDYHSRADVYICLGQYKDAISDMSLLIDRQTLVNESTIKRGMAYELAGEVDLAMADYTVAAATDGITGQYAQLWKYLLMRRIGNRSEAPHSLVAAPNFDAWVRKLVDLFNGQITGTELVSSAATLPERCEAHYYIGMKSLFENDLKAAAASFAACTALKQHGVLETYLARSRLAECRLSRLKSSFQQRNRPEASSSR